MPGIALFSTGRTDTYPEFSSSVLNGHEPAAVSPPLSREFVESVTDPRTGKVHLWGTAAETKWESVEPGEIALAYKDGRYRAQGVVVGKEVDRSLAEQLWSGDGDSGEADRSRRFLTFLTGVEDVELAKADLNQLVGYDEGYAPKGLVPIADHRIASVRQRHRSVESAVEELTGTEFLRFQDDGDAGAPASTGRPSSVLLDESERTSAEATCTALSSVTDPSETHLLAITFDGAPDDRLSRWERRNNGLPNQTGVITIGELTRSSASAPPSGPGPTRVTIDSLPEPSDLTGLAMAISSYVEAWEDSDAETVVCFDSLTPLLIHTDIERVFRFVYTTLARLRDIGAYAHFHLEPDAHEARTVDLIDSMFDATIRVTEDGSASIDRNRA